MTTLGESSQRSVLKWVPVAVVIGFTIFWELLARANMISPLFFPAPSVIFSTFIEMVNDGTLFSNLWVSLFRIFGGFFVGGSVGLVLGLAMGWSSRLRMMLDPIIAALHPIPKLAILPVILIIFGFGERSRIILVSISTFFQMLINSMGGVLQISPTYFEAARNYGANRWQIFWNVVLPGSLPSVLTGSRLALNMALVITLVVELTFANEGLGTLLWVSWETLQTDILYAVVIVLSLMGFFFNFILLRLKLRVVSWQT